MSRIEIPNGWRPRPYQLPLYNGFGYGKRYQRASLIWHRRAGKDSAALNITAREMFKRVGVYWHLFPEQAQARKAIWNGIDAKGRRIIDQFLPPEARDPGNPKSEVEMLIRAQSGSSWQMAGSDNYNSLVGSNPVGVVFSEWALANPAAWDYIRPMLLENGGWALFITTPRGRNHAYETHMMAQANGDWFDQILTVDDTGRITPDMIERERAEGMPEATIQQEYYCSFEADSEIQFIPSQYITNGRAIEHPEVQPDDPVILGVDVARFGDDKSVIFPRRGRDARTLPVQVFEGVDTMTLAAHVADTITRLNAEATFIDEGGVGAGVVDRLRQLNFRVIGVNFGAGSDRRVEGAPPTANKRAEMWATMREHMREGLALPRDDGLAFELLAPTYHFDPANRILLEKKEDMKKRGVRSPDKADALALTYAYPVVGRTVAERLEAQAAEEYDPIFGRR